jgi:hypothetical protein
MASSISSHPSPRRELCYYSRGDGGVGRNREVEGVVIEPSNNRIGARAIGAVRGAKQIAQ